MILLRDAIIREINSKRIIITPFSEDQLGYASVDLHLGNLCYKFMGEVVTLPIKEDLEMESFMQSFQISEEQPLTLNPGEMVLGTTQEIIKLSDDIAAFLEGRSRFARAGLGIHITSSFIRPGTESNQTLEIVNHSPTTLTLTPGLRICQVVFVRCEK